MFRFLKCVEIGPYYVVQSDAAIDCRSSRYKGV